ncbi:MAG: hypothetical protein HRU27_01470 [Rhizobiaceae bacterium]|nr:hypothetical protein [Rhizobiaceae bacterium]
MWMQTLFEELAATLDGEAEIERVAAKALLNAAPLANDAAHSKWEPLPDKIIDVLLRDDALPVCQLIAESRFPWAPPQTSDDPKYIEHSLPKVHVELLGPEGLIASKDLRLGLYGMLPNFEYGIRTHPAEEVFVMLAGEAHWKRGESDYAPLGPGGRSLHPSMLPHANKTQDQSFMSIYVWRGDVSTDGYQYQGIPEN